MSVKMKRSKIILDMTPMVDIGFLLVIFFMSTYHARPPVTVSVNLPESRSPFKVPESNIMVLNVLSPSFAKTLADSIGPTDMLNLITAIREASAQEGATVASLKSMPQLQSASTELLREIVEAEPKPLTRGRSCELAIREIQRPNNFINQLAKQDIRGINALPPDQAAVLYNNRVDSMVIWYATGKDASQPLPVDQLGTTVVDERMRNPKMMMVLQVDKGCLSGKMLDITSILNKKDVNMLRFSLVTQLKAGSQPMFGEEVR